VVCFLDALCLDHLIGRGYDSFVKKTAPENIRSRFRHVSPRYVKAVMLKLVAVCKNRDFQPISRFISETIQDTTYHSYNGILTETYACPNQRCKFERP